MDWIVGMQKAINYIEEHLTSEIDFTDLAQFVSYSPRYFQKLFGLLCGTSVGDYIRKRRLTLAGNEICSSDIKISDIAQKYGYDNPNSFTRAFIGFHGISPTEVREKEVTLKSFSPLHLKISVEGGNSIDYKIIEKEEFYILGKVEKHTIVEKEEYASINHFWNRMMEDGQIQKIMNLSIDTEHIYGIGFDDQLNREREIDYLIGVLCDEDCLSLKEFTKYKIPKRTWAVFPCKGKLPYSIFNLWSRILSEFFPIFAYKPTGEYEIEIHNTRDWQTDQYYCELWITVQK